MIPRRSFVTLVVLWVIAMASAVISIVQASSFSQATSGREALARVRAQWAARAGVEIQIARLEAGTENPNPDDAFMLIEDMAAVASGDLDGATYEVVHSTPRGERAGPVDAHARININRMTFDDLMTLPFMTEDTADAILDWIDADEDPNVLGAEAGYYQGLSYPYEPRNGPIRSLLELELVAGVDPYYVRGEDWNLNGVLDPNEDDGYASPPGDNADGVLDAGWSAIVTADSVDGGFGRTGQPRLNLTQAAEKDLIARTNVTAEQAKTILDHVSLQSSARMSDFLRRTLPQISQQLSGGQPGTVRPQPLSDEQLGALLSECHIVRDPAAPPEPGKLNLNTCDSRIFEYLPSIDSALADAIMAERDARRQGFVSFVELRSIPGMTPARMAALYEIADVRSNVFVLTSRGRDIGTGIEVEITAVLDRSTLPVRIASLMMR
ncbi:MAG: general secretion pathway protein GspK [Phycisphaeraceae bacterium]|nr:general secretion pathway protein GspK [Phycisphaerae bacterium]MBX3391750.1 general secretion pathway protein GspK [Phycisphaeraceae bacterium]